MGTKKNNNAAEQLGLEPTAEEKPESLQLIKTEAALETLESNARALQLFEDYRRLIAKPPSHSEIKDNDLVKVKKKSTGVEESAKMLEIGTVEAKLDMIMNGMWKAHSFKYQVVANEIIGDLILEYLVPGTTIWLSRPGAGAIPIQQNRGAQISDINAKIKNALQKNLPALKAECLKNAAKSIGDAFGRSLNREDLSEIYKDYIPETDKLTELKALVLKDYTLETMNDKSLMNKHLELQKGLTSSERVEIQRFITAHKVRLSREEKEKKTK